MALEREYKIDAASRHCHRCETVFAVGQEYYSAVAETSEEDRLQRQDFCLDCWQPTAGTYFSFWKTRVPEPEAVQQRGPRLVDLARLMQLFEHLADSPDVQAQRFRYVLALVLMRKRRLKVVESRRLSGGRGEELTLRETGGQRTHLVSCPNITDDEIRSVADRLRDILDMPEKWDQVQAGEPAESAADSSAEASAQADSSAEASAQAEAAGAAPGPDGAEPPAAAAEDRANDA